jgi:5-methylcytosine-specific restriction protein A
VGKPSAMPRAWVDFKDERGSAHSRGYGVAWRRLREVVLDAEPLCRECAKRGRATPAKEVDHILPLRDGGTNDRENLQPLCCECHDDKTVRDVRTRRARRRDQGRVPEHDGGASKTEEYGRDRI